MHEFARQQENAWAVLNYPGEEGYKYNFTLEYLDKTYRLKN